MPVTIHSDVVRESNLRASVVSLIFARSTRLVARVELKKFAVMHFRERRAKLEGRDVHLAEEIELLRDRLQHSRRGL